MRCLGRLDWEKTGEKVLMVHADPVGSPGAAGGRGERDSDRKQVDILRALETANRNIGTCLTASAMPSWSPTPSGRSPTAVRPLPSPSAASWRKLSGSRRPQSMLAKRNIKTWNVHSTNMRVRRTFFTVQHRKKSGEVFPAGSSGKLLLAAGTPAVFGYRAGGPKHGAGAP